MERIALFPGSFDPFTLGHEAIVKQGLEIFDKIVVGIGCNSQKKGLLKYASRMHLIRDIFARDKRVIVTTYNGLTGDFCREEDLRFVLRGMRNAVDYEYERDMMLINQKLYPDITTVLLFTPPQFVAISSSVIRELISFGKDPAQLMPESINIKNYL